MCVRAPMSKYIDFQKVGLLNNLYEGIDFIYYNPVLH